MEPSVDMGEKAKGARLDNDTTTPARNKQEKNWKKKKKGSR